MTAMESSYGPKAWAVVAKWKDLFETERCNGIRQHVRSAADFHWWALPKFTTDFRYEEAILKTNRLKQEEASAYQDGL